MGKTLSLNSFAMLLLATLADNSETIVNHDNKVAIIPTNYKQIIENILCAENGWRDKFSVLIDTTEYFNDHFEWERQLAKQIQAILNKMGKTFKYDFERDNIHIYFSQTEIDIILSQYNDKNIKNTMKHFVSLLNDCIYTREYQEQVHDYSSRSFQYMNRLRKEGKI